MVTRFIEERIDYTGEQLRSHWIYERFGIPGDAMVSFIGRCEVGFDEMVDLEDVLAEKPIRSEQMLHFIAEHFDTDLERALLRQRLLMAVILEILNRSVGSLLFRREGDDIFSGDAKLSVSIATCSPVSTLIHVGLNITAENIPVKAVGLADYDIDPKTLAESIMKAYSGEIEGVISARVKVRWVR
ncbi:TPA: DUF366 family protein [Candidatus Poribacteria bacterium]|nr:DUF366 family protein [Candidatus Poribacteria bacterium]